jgi:hypothetical protein
MERRRFLTLLVATPAALFLVGCGSDDGGAESRSESGDSLPARTDPPATTPRTTPPTTAPPSFPADEDVVLEYSELGGFTTFEYNFQSPPEVLVTTGDRVLTRADVIAVFPGPLVPQHVEQTITPEGVDLLLATAEGAGLFRDVDYDADPFIADASTATVTIVESDNTWIHEASALGLGTSPDGGEASADRVALAEFVVALGDLPSLVGEENLGEPETYVPGAYQVIAQPTDGATFEPQPTEVPWPSGTGIGLAEIAATGECVALERGVVGDLFDTAHELTFFVEDGVTYQVVVRPDYPGQTC